MHQIVDFLIILCIIKTNKLVNIMIIVLYDFKQNKTFMVDIKIE